ncbi:MAG: sugar ABC transporter permease [Caldilineaceae bacterium]|nr:sugar ABC transporter permease [Caldilineaceae bacterium]
MTNQHQSASGARWDWLTPYLFLAPAFLLLIALRYLPAVQAVYYSFTEWKGFFGSPEFVGFSNYSKLFHDQIFLASLRNMVVYTVVRTLLVLGMTFFAAELIYSLRNPTMQFIWQVLLIIPMIIPEIVVFLVWGFVFNTQTGILNTLLTAIGLGSWAQPWLSQSSTALWAITFIGFPFVASIPFLIFTSSLQGMPGEVLEAAKLDGCNTLRRVLHIDLPLMRGPITLAVILLILEGIRVLLPQLVLTGGGPGSSTESPANYLYRTAFQYGDFGLATAVGMIMLLVGLVFSYLSLRIRYQEATDVDI